MTPQVQAVIAGYIEKIQTECDQKQWAILQTRKPEIASDLQAESPEIQIAFVRAVLANASALSPTPAGIEATVLGKMLSGLFGSKLADRRLNWLEFRTLGGVLSCVLRQKLPLEPDPCGRVVEAMRP